MEDTDAALLDAIEARLLSPVIVEAAMVNALAQLTAVPVPPAGLHAELADLDAQLARLTEALK